MKTRFAALLAFFVVFCCLARFCRIGRHKRQNGVECNIEIAFDYAVDQLSVEFSNISLGNYDLLLWDFGDHNSSREAKPKHTYAQEGKYDFCLTAINTERQCENRFCGEVYVFK
ncbi:MAG: PKD domain-containing protein [Sphingobacteriales bacterium]|nr:PKD domain-containing protein [Sphingobacteriales bacterium]